LAPDPSCCFRCDEPKSRSKARLNAPRSGDAHVGTFTPSYSCWRRCRRRRAVGHRLRAIRRQVDVLLIPGAWHGAWCYRRVADLLIARGHKVHALTLTGLGDRVHLASDAVNMDTHIADIVNFVKWEDLNNFVLVGHSYGGLPITGAADQIGDKVSSIIYLDAFIPEDGQSMVDIVKRPMPSTGTAPPFPAKAFKVNEKDEAYVNAKMTPQPINTYTQKIKVAGAYKKIAKKTYVRSLQFNNPAFQVLYEALKQDAAWKTHTLDCGHDMMVDKPEELAGILETSA
jgi:pimeloyl-ACP methyl ester carboxylesterase